MRKKAFAVVLTAVMTASMLSAAVYADETASEAPMDDLTDQEQEALDAGLINLDGTLPIITDPEAFEEKYGKISALIVNSADRVVPVGDLAMCQKWFEDTGVEFDWQPIPSEGAQEKINLMLASGEELPDVFWNFGDGKSGNIVVQYADQEIFLPTENLIANYMPNLKKILDDHPTYQMEITAPDGHTYGFPYVEEMKGLVLTPGPWLINKTWLDAVGKDVPTTVDEWVDCLKAFRDGGDLNGNGEADEIPMATWFGANDTFGSYNMFYRFTGAFGCADSYCGGNEYADHLRLVDGKVTFTAMDEAFRKTAEFFNMLYNENLIWNGSFEADSSAAYQNSLVKENVARIGSFGTWTDQEITDIDVHDQYVALPRLKGEDGYNGFENNYSELQDSSEYQTCGEARVNSTTCRGSMIVLNEYYDTVCRYTFDAVQLLENQYTNGKEDIMNEYETIPRVLMTTDELSRLAQIQPPISDIVDRYINVWVQTGVTDDNWQAYLDELNAAGVDELVSIYQDAVDRSSK